MHRATAGERLAGTYAWLIVALRFIVPVAWVAAAVAAWFALPALGGSSTAPLGDIVPSDARAVVAQEHALKLFGSTVGTDTAVVQRNPRGLSRAEVASPVRLARSIAQHRAPAGLAGVRAVAPVPNARVPGLRWREEGTTVVSYLFLGPDLNLKARDDVAHRYAAQLVREPGSSVGVTGAGPARLEQFRAIDDALPWVTLATIGVILLVVAVYFRSLGAPIVTLLTAAIGYVLAIRLLAWAGERAGFTAPSEIEPVLVVLLLGLVTDYTVFFMAETRRRLARGEPRVPAARAATARMAPIVFTAGIVVAGGAVSLLAGNLEFFRVFGPGLALCALVVTVVCVTFVPAMLGLVGPWLFGRRVREAEPAEVELPAAVAAGRGVEGRERRERLRVRFAPLLGSVRAGRRQAQMTGGRVAPAVVARLLGMRAVAVVVAAACLVALLAAASAGRSADLAVSFIPSLPRDTEARHAADDAARGFGPGILAPTEVIVEAPGIGGRLAALARVQQRIADQPGVATVLGPRQPQGTPLTDFVISRDGNAARYAVVLAEEPTGARAVGDFERLRARMPGLLRAAGLPAGARVSYAGETALASETVGALKHDLVRIAVATLVVVFVLLAIFLRALVAPLLLLFGSALAVAAAFGLTTLILGDAGAGRDFIYYVPLVAGVLLVGLGSDYNVFIAGRIREEARRRRLREAIAVGAPSASRAITVAGITLAGTFALLALVPLRPFRELALLMAIGVLVDALFVRPLLIPALIAIVGRFTWWPARPARPPDAETFLARVGEHAQLGEDGARRMTEATLETLAERIPRRESLAVAALLAPEVGRPLRESAGVWEPFGADEFVNRVAERAGVPAAEARRGVRAVGKALSEALPETEVDYIRAALSPDYRWVFGDAPDVTAEDREGRHRRADTERAAGVGAVGEE